MLIDLRAVAEWTNAPPSKRSAESVAMLVEKLKQLQFFREVGERAGSKILFDYCSHLNSTVAIAHHIMNLSNVLVVVLRGEVTVKDNQQDLQFHQGESFELVGGQRCTALTSVMLVTLDLKIRKRLLEMEQNARRNRERKFASTRSRDYPLQQTFLDLKQASFLSSMFDADLKELALKSKVKCCRPGQTIYSETDKPAYLFCLVSGKVQIEERSQPPQIKSSLAIPRKTKTNRISMSICYPNDIFGLEEILQAAAHYRAIATSKTEVKLVCIPSEAVHDLINRTTNRQLHENLQSLVETKRQVLFSRRHQPPQLPEEHVQQNVSKRILELTNTPVPITKCLVSRADSLPYQCYLPQKLFHESATSPMFLKATKERVLDIGMLQAEKHRIRSSRYRAESRRRSRNASVECPKINGNEQLQDDKEERVNDRQITLLGFLKSPTTSTPKTSSSIHTMYSSFRQSSQTRTLRWLDN